MNAQAQLHRIVNGAVTDAFKMHPDYLTSKGTRSARGSINKRVVGALWGFVEQSTGGRTLQGPADQVMEPSPVLSQAGGAGILPPATFPVRLRLKSIKHKPGLGPVGRRRLAARINTHLALREAQHG